MGSPDRLERLRAHIAQTIRHATELISDLDALDDGLELLMPSLGELTEAERATEHQLARLETGDEPTA